MKILLVEDDPAIHHRVGACLPSGDDVEVASTLAGALAVLRHGEFDLVLLDLGLPDSTGLATLVRVLDVVDPLPVVVLTSSEDMARDALRAGAADFLPKARLDAGALERGFLRAQERVRLRAEIDQRDTQLRRADQLAGVGVLAAGVAHEINNPAVVLTMNLAYVRDALQHRRLDRQQLDEALAECQDAIAIVARVGRQLTGYVRRDQLDVVRVDLAEVARRATSLVRNRVRHHARLELDLQAGALQGDPTRLTQLVVNLVVNAGDAVESAGGGGVVTVSTRRVDDHVELVVSDTGVGMDPETVQRMFDAFYTTKLDGRGTGLGMAIVLGVVEFHGGQMRAESERGQGTTVTVRLPVEPTASLESAEEPPSQSALLPDEDRPRVLLVDDDRQVRAMTRRVLRRHLDLVAVGSGDEALRRLEVETFDCVVCDISMPGMSGPELYQALPARIRRLFVFATGGAIGLKNQRFLNETDRPVLFKPYSRDELMAAIRELS